MANHVRSTQHNSKAVTLRCQTPLKKIYSHDATPHHATSSKSTGGHSVAALALPPRSHYRHACISAAFALPWGHTSDHEPNGDPSNAGTASTRSTASSDRTRSE